jgi:hypothetical protein
MEQSYWLLYAGLAVFVVGAYVDGYLGARNYIYYGRREANKLWQNEYGFLAWGKTLVWQGIFIAGLVVASYLLNYPIFAGILFAILGTIRIVWGASILSSMKDERANQIEVLKALKEQAALGNTNPADPVIDKIFRGRRGAGPLVMKGDPVEAAGPVVTKSGRSWYSNFAWLWIESTGDNASAIIPLRIKIIEHAQKPEGEWFPA